MKKLLTITLLLLSNIAVFGDSIGYIDTQRIMSEYSAVKEFEITLEKQQEKYLKKVEESEKKIQKARDKKKSDKDIEKLIQEAQAELFPLQQSILQSKTAMENQIIGKISAVSQIVAKEHDIDVVINKSALLSGGFDLTEFVLNKLNE